MKLTIDKDGFLVDTGHGLKVRLDDHDMVFMGDNRYTSLPADDLSEFISQLELAYKMLIGIRSGDIKVSDVPEKIVSQFRCRHRDILGGVS